MPKLAETNFKIAVCPVGKQDPRSWVTLTPYDPAVFIEGVAVFKYHLVLSARVNGLPQLLVRNLATPHATTRTKNRHMKPKAIAKVAEATALCGSDPAIGTCESDAVRMVSVAASGPTMSWRNDPKIA